MDSRRRGNDDEMKFNSKQLTEMSNAVRAGALFAIRSGRSGHVGIVLGMSDVITTIYANFLRPTRDTFVLSAGHGSAMLYSVLKLTGHKIPALKTFRKFGGLSGHPEFGVDGVAASTGPLGAGVANAVGYALAAKIKGARAQGRKGTSSKTSSFPLPPSSFVYCMCSDGDLMEGVASEAIGFAGRYKLNNLVLFWDDNGISIDGVAQTEPDIPMRMRAAGFNILKIAGDDFDEIDRALTMAQKSDKPVFIQCKTVIGAGSSVAGTNAAHAYGLNESELLELEQKFTSSAGLKLWDKVSKQSEKRKAKSENINELKLEVNSQFTIHNSQLISTRELSGQFLEKLAAIDSNLIGGSADLGVSTNTKTKSHREITPTDFSGNYINYGVREHAMGAIMNGLTAAGFRAYGGTFLVFSDYMRPAIRLAAFSKIPTIFVFSHDSIAVGEDGPTHQPVEQLPSLRLMPNLNVFRPANAAEVEWSWRTALSETDRPSCIILSRQKFKQIDQGLCHPHGGGLSGEAGLGGAELGGYVIYKPAIGYRLSAIINHKSAMTLIATGSEVPLACAVADILAAKKIAVSVVSMPSVEKFRAQSNEYKRKILAGHVIAIEAGATHSWFEFADAVVGVDTFGAGGPGKEVYEHFGFDADKIATEIIKKIQ